MNILELPYDVIGAIGAYITHNDDVVSLVHQPTSNNFSRFSFTCKLLKSLAFATERTLEISGKDSKFNRNYLASQDLSRVKSLILQHGDESHGDESVFPIVKIQLLSTLYNIKSLAIYFWLDMEEYERSIVDAITKMTWLEALECNLQMPENLGSLLANHTRLTTLKNGSEVHVIDYYKLTQLKAFDAPTSTYGPNASSNKLHQVLLWTKLTVLDISYSDFPTEALQELTRLTNLEEIGIAGINRPDGFDWKILLSLPKLRSLADDPDFNNSSHLLSVLTQLTKFQIFSSDSSDPYCEELYDLTNLQHLGCYREFIDSSIDVAPLVNLTELHVQGSSDTTEFGPLPQLKVLSIEYSPSMTQPERFFDSVCNAVTLETLQLTVSIEQQIHKHAFIAPFITRLTKLQRLQLNFGLSAELARSLINMPSLCSLEVYSLSDYCSSVIKRATQLVELKVENTTKLQSLRREFPFAVYRK